MNKYIEDLNWRYATKKFDPAKKISETDLEILKEAIRLSPSSYGLQPYKVFILEDENLREQLRPAAWGQAQITEASHVVVIAGSTKLDDALIDSYITEIAQVRGLEPESLQGMSAFMKGKILPLPEETKIQWTEKQAYIALGNLLSAAAQLKIDACPMEGFDPEAVDKLLGLAEKDLKATLIIPIGYRSEEDKSQFYKKVRRPKSELFTTI